MRIVFMGTPDFAVASLNALVEAGHEITAVITQPDRPKGRGNKMAFPEVKTRALELKIPVYQPESVKDESFLELLQEMAPEVIIVVAYGRILPEAVLKLPPYGCLNVHGSLLPAYRGAAPIQRAVLNGDRETGVTIMQMDLGMDTGDILTQKAIEITDEDTTGTMFDRLAILGGELLVETLVELQAGKIVAVPQDETQATYAEKVLKAHEIIDWQQGAEQIFHQIRGLAPTPGAYTLLKEQRIKIWRSRYQEENSGRQPGEIVGVTAEGFLVQTGQGVLEVLEVQPAGKKTMPAKAFCNGGAVIAGVKLGE